MKAKCPICNKSFDRSKISYSVILRNNERQHFCSEHCSNVTKQLLKEREERKWIIVNRY